MKLGLRCPVLRIFYHWLHAGTFLAVPGEMIVQHIKIRIHRVIRPVKFRGHSVLDLAKDAQFT
jgi:hypothetical protein